MRQMPGLRTHLLALVLAVLVPALAVGAAAAWQAATGHQRAFEARLQDTARALALALDARIGADLAVLTALAAALALDVDADQAAREGLLRRAAASLGADLAFMDLTGRLLNDTGALAGGAIPASVFGGPAKRVVETGQPMISDLVASTVTGRPVVSPIVPVLREGRVVGALAARLDPAPLAELLRAQSLPEGGFTVLKDSQYYVVARSLNHEAAVGRPVPPAFREAIAGRVRGLTEGRSLEGSPTYGAFERLKVAPDWTISVVVPRAAYTQSWARPLATLAVGAVPLLLLSGTLALWLGRRLLHPVDVLRSHARAVVRGRGADSVAFSAPHSVLGVRSGVAEFEALSEDIAAAEAALCASEAQWRALFERMHEGFALCEIIWDGNGRAVNWRYLELNTAWERLTGIPVKQALGRRMTEVFPEIKEFWIRTCAHVVETGQPAHVEHQASKVGCWFEAFVYRTEPGRFAILFLDVTKRKEAEERQTLLSREVDHRAKNALAVVQAALRLTKAEDIPSFVRAIEGRVATLARAQTLLAEDRWTGADLLALLRGELEPFLGAAGEGGPRANLSGPKLVLPPRTTQPLAMAVHELATNAVKHGALSVPEGRLSVHWRLQRDPVGAEVLHLSWVEAGGPPVAAPPKRCGFGTRVLDGTVRRQLNGTIQLHWHETGLVCEVVVPLYSSSDPTATGQTAH